MSGPFGWDYPPGCNSTPYDETGSVALDIPRLPKWMGAWWTEDDDLGLTVGRNPKDTTPLAEYDDGTYQITVGKYEWSNDLTEQENMDKAAETLLECLVTIAMQHQL